MSSEFYTSSRYYIILDRWLVANLESERSYGLASRSCRNSHSLCICILRNRASSWNLVIVILGFSGCTARFQRAAAMIKPKVKSAPRCQCIGRRAKPFRGCASRILLSQSLDSGTLQQLDEQSVWYIKKWRREDLLLEERFWAPSVSTKTTQLPYLSHHRSLF